MEASRRRARNIARTSTHRDEYTSRRTRVVGDATNEAGICSICMPYAGEETPTVGYMGPTNRGTRDECGNGRISMLQEHGH